MGFFSDLFKERSSTTTLDPMLTSEQIQAMKSLGTLGQTGQLGDIKLGEAYQGSLGNFDMSNVERLAGNKLYDLLNSGTSQDFSTARGTFNNLANTQFDPTDPSSGYAAYARQVSRATQDANDALNRDAAITGDRFSTSLGRQKTDLAAQQSDILATKLADLYNTSQNRALAGAQGLVGLGQAQEEVDQGRLGAAFNYGGLERQLKNAQDQVKYSEFQRSRAEKLSQIDVLNNLFNKSVSFGKMSETTNAPSIFSQIYGQTNPLVGDYNTAKYGSAQAPNQSSMKDLVKMFSGLPDTGSFLGGSKPKTQSDILGYNTRSYV